jgi:hypothetical protein
VQPDQSGGSYSQADDQQPDAGGRGFTRSADQEREVRGNVGDDKDTGGGSRFG